MEIGATTEPTAKTRHAPALLFGDTNGSPSGLAVLASVLLNSVAVGLTQQAEHLVAEMTHEERGTGPMRPVVVLLLAGDDHDAAIRVVASAADASMPVDHGAGPPAAMPSPVTPDPLTEAESRILRYLPTNLSAPEIAAELFCSVNTVKTHTRHVYTKLGAGSRTEAVRRARALGMLASTAARPSGYPAIPHGRRRVRFAEVQAQ
jgi:DNA-binding CsgD family transcriptional regulator